MTRRNTLLALSLLFLACATHPLHVFERPDTSSNSVVWVNFVENFPNDSWIGLSIPFIQEPQIIQIKDGMPVNKTLRVVAHEMLHAAGYKAHIPAGAKDCYFNPAADDLPLGPPCPAEVAKVKKINRKFTVVAMDPRLIIAVRWASAMWNEAAGREVFIAAN